MHQSATAPAAPIQQTISLNPVNNTLMMTVVAGVIVIVLAIAVVGVMILRKK